MVIIFTVEGSFWVKRSKRPHGLSSVYFFTCIRVCRYYITLFTWLFNLFHSRIFPALISIRSASLKPFLVLLSSILKCFTRFNSLEIGHKFFSEIAQSLTLLFERSNGRE